MAEGPTLNCVLSRCLLYQLYPFEATHGMVSGSGDELCEPGYRVKSECTCRVSKSGRNGTVIVGAVCAPCFLCDVQTNRIADANPSSVWMLNVAPPQIRRTTNLVEHYRRNPRPTH